MTIDDTCCDGEEIAKPFLIIMAVGTKRCREERGLESSSVDM